MPRREKRIAAADEGRSVHDVLKNDLLFSEGLISRLKRRPEGILLDGEKAYTTAAVLSGQLLSAETGDGAETLRPEPMPYPLRVLYEDAYYIVIDKPAGLSVHVSGRSPGELTLENALAARLPEGENPHPVSRLDRGTTGVMCWAKSGYAHELLRRQIHTPGYRRIYAAVIEGTDLPGAGRICLPVGRREDCGYRRFIAAEGAFAATRYEVVAREDGRSLLRVEPETGRTHQIRLHFSAMGFPLAGDRVYGRGTEDTRPLLHSAALEMIHPLTGERLRIAAPLPEDMKLFWNSATF